MKKFEGEKKKKKLLFLYLQTDYSTDIDTWIAKVIYLRREI